MQPEIVVAVCSLFGTLAGSLAGIMTANKLTMYRIEQLEEKDSDCKDFGTCNYCQRYWCPRILIDRDDAIDIVKAGGMNEI